MTEIELYSHISDEEFELIRLNKLDRRREILKNMRVRIFYTMFDVIRIDGIDLISRDCSFSNNLHTVLLHTQITN